MLKYGTVTKGEGGLFPNFLCVHVRRQWGSTYICMFVGVHYVRKKSTPTCPPALGVALRLFFHQKNWFLGCFGGVFGPILALFWPKQAFVGQNEPNTPPKPGFFGEKNGHRATPSAGGQVGSGNILYLVHTHLRTYICR